MFFSQHHDRVGTAAASGPWDPARLLTKPVLLATQRAMPRWVGWILISLPSLSLLGTWLVGRLPVFQALAVVLLGIAVWDWSRYFDRSRTMFAVLGLSAGVIVSGTVAAVVFKPPANELWVQAISVGSLLALALALVQLYRNEQTVLTVVRGWLYAVAILTGITIYQRVTRDLPALSGPFPSPGYLAGSMLAGVFLLPVGFALEKDRRLRWAYPVVAVMATWVVWTTHRSVGFAVCLLVLLVWLALYRWIVATLLAGLGLVAVIVFRSVAPLRWADVGMEPPLDGAIHADLIRTSFLVLRDSSFLGVGPGGLAAHWPAEYGAYRGPYSAIAEIASQYGLTITVALASAFLGVLTWCLVRLWQTRRQKLWSADRAPAFWLGLMVISLPISTSLQAQWLDFPLSALGAATLALLARHIESPKGRALVWSAGPGAGKEADGPPDHGPGLQNETGEEGSPSQVQTGAVQNATSQTADQDKEREPQQHRTGDGDQPDLAGQRQDLDADPAALGDLSADEAPQAHQ